MISRTLESWRSLPRLTLREAAAIAGISKRKLEQRLPQLDVIYDGATRFVSTESLRRYLGEGVEETRRVVVQVKRMTLSQKIYLDPVLIMSYSININEAAGLTRDGQEDQEMAKYEWDVETVVTRGTDEHEAGEVVDHHHCTSFAEALIVADRPTDKGFRHAIALVRDDNQGRSWSYLEDDGALAVYFTDAHGHEVAKVPHRFIREVSH